MKMRGISQITVPLCLTLAPTGAGADNRPPPGDLQNEAS